MPRLPSFRPSPMFPWVNLDEESWVENFIVPFTILWNKQLLDSTFDLRSVANILRIRLPVPGGADRVVWTPESQGGFSVKSAYYLLVSDRHNPSTNCPSINWNSLWKLNLQARLKFLLWKIAWDILPTRENLSRSLRGNFHGSVSCPLCDAPEESLPHLLFFCSFTRLVWRLSPCVSKY